MCINRFCADLGSKFTPSSEYTRIRVGPHPPVKATTDDNNDDDDDEDGDDDRTRDGHDDRGERQTASSSARGHELEQRIYHLGLARPRRAREPERRPPDV